MNEYEKRQQERKERYKERADKARAEADAHFKRAKDIGDAIPFGQPILVGHHSEKRHRGDIERGHRTMRAGVDATSKARHYDAKAEGVGRAGISSDDPGAIVKLKTKLDNLERNRQQMKAINAAWRKAGKPSPDNLEGWRKVADAPEVQMNVNDLGRVRLDMARQPYHKAPFPPYALQNLGGRITTTSKRIEELEAAASQPEAEPIEGDGWLVYEDQGENRICFEFPDKPSDAVRSILKGAGWRWNRRLGVWTRHLNNAGRASAEMVARKLEEERNT